MTGGDWLLFIVFGVQEQWFSFYNIPLPCFRQCSCFPYGKETVYFLLPFL